MSPPFSNPGYQNLSHESLLDSDIKLEAILMDNISGCSNSSSSSTSKLSDMTSGGDSFQSARDRAQRLAATPIRGTSILGQTQPVDTPTNSSQYSNTVSSWRPDQLMGRSHTGPIMGGNFEKSPGPLPSATYNQATRDQMFGSTPTQFQQSFGYTGHPKTYLSAQSGDFIAQLQSPIKISQQLLDTRYAYAIRRDDGTFTRLIPADQLPKMRGLPQTQGPEGLIVVPAPRAASPLSSARGQLTTQYEAMPSAIGSGRPGPAFDGIQAQIDDIVALSPPQPVLTPRKKKVYCDKWVHDGVCAFTQQGCKFKHEMPMDRQTQHELGLFNGLPPWYRRQHGIELKSSPPTADSSISRSGMSSTWGSSRGVLTADSPPSRGGSGISGWRSAARRGPSGSEGRRAPWGTMSDHRSKNQFELLYETEEDF